MTRYIMALLLVLVTAVSAGCGKKEQKPATPAKEAAETTEAWEEAAEPAEAIVEKPAEGADEAVKQAEAMLEQVHQCIEDGELDQAETHLKALEAKKDSLPQSLQDEIDAARKLLEASKPAEKAKGVELPEVAE